MHKAGPYAPSQRISPIVKANAAKIGIILINRGRPVDEPASNNPLVANVQWVKPWPDPASVMFRCFRAQGSARPRTSTGRSPGSRRRRRPNSVWRRIKGVPSVDADIRRCDAPNAVAPLPPRSTGSNAGIAPVIPFLWRNSITILGPQVAKWAFDQSTGTTAFAHVAVKR